MTVLIPYQKFEIKTRLSPEVVRQRLAELVEPRKFMRLGLSRKHNVFEGEIDGTSFKISRIIHYNNGFLPILVGQIRDDLDASTLQIVARPMWFIILFWAIFIGSVTMGGLIAGDPSDTWVILPTFLLFYVVPTAFFNFELYKAKQLLNEQFEADKFSEPF